MFRFLLNDSQEATCFDYKDMIMGGTSGTTSYSTLDYDGSSNIVVGGWSSDYAVVGTSTQTAIILYIV